jgi:hypothetical protein
LANVGRENELEIDKDLVTIQERAQILAKNNQPFLDEEQTICILELGHRPKLSY